MDIRTQYKLMFPKNSWGGIRASLFINGVLFMALAIGSPLFIILTSNDRIDWQMVIFVFSLGLFAFLLSGIYLHFYSIDSKASDKEELRCQKDTLIL